MRLFFDLNVILDVLGRREPWFEHSAAILSLVEEGAAKGFVAAHSVTTLDYLLAKHQGRERATTALVELLGLVRAASVDHDVLLKALSLGWTDFEDAVQAICALDLNADHLITRDPEDFPNLSISVVTPSELLALLSERSEQDSEEATSGPDEA